MTDNNFMSFAKAMKYLVDGYRVRRVTNELFLKEWHMSGNEIYCYLKHPFDRQINYKCFDEDDLKAENYQIIGSGED